MTQDEITHAARNSTLVMQTVQLIDYNWLGQAFIALFADTKEAEKSPYKVAALNGQRRRLCRRVKKSLEDGGVCRQGQADLRLKVFADVRLNPAAGTDEHQGDVGRVAE